MKLTRLCSHATVAALLLARVDSVKVHHDHLVSFLGYCLKPTLLICMEYVDGGTLEAFLELFDPANPPEVQVVMKILLGSTAGFAYLHAMEPLPILHRDIKSENILLTSDYKAKIADLGEARVMAENKAMTVVGTNVSATAASPPCASLLPDSRVASFAPGLHCPRSAEGRALRHASGRLLLCDRHERALCPEEALS